MTTSYAYCSTDNSTTGLYKGRVDTVWVDSGGLNLATETRYDAAGNVAKVTKDPGGLALTVTSSSDPWGNLLAGRSALGYTTSYSRDASGRTLLTARTDPAGHLLAQSENSWDQYGVKWSREFIRQEMRNLLALRPKLNGHAL